MGLSCLKTFFHGPLALKIAKKSLDGHGSNSKQHVEPHTRAMLIPHMTDPIILACYYELEE